MKNHADLLLGEATQEELTACVRLLAMSVVQHRANDSFVPFREAANSLRSEDDNTDRAGLIAEGGECGGRGFGIGPRNRRRSSAGVRPGTGQHVGGKNANRFA